ncbi:hypothetical protein AALA82_12255 [Oscillospiraceae bacterium 50-16]
MANTVKLHRNGNKPAAAPELRRDSHAAPPMSGAAVFLTEVICILQFKHRSVIGRRCVNMKDQTNPSINTSYKEIKIGKTLYRVTSVFTGEKDLGETLEQLAVRRAMAELTPCHATT